MLFVFVFANDDPVVDTKTGLTMQPSYSVQAANLREAVCKIAAYRSANMDGSADPNDYETDIDNGDIEFFVPTAV